MCGKGLLVSEITSISKNCAFGICLDLNSLNESLFSDGKYHEASRTITS